jgi:hypothetical protein
MTCLGRGSPEAEIVCGVFLRALLQQRLHVGFRHPSQQLPFLCCPGGQKPLRSHLVGGRGGGS